MNIDNIQSLSQISIKPHESQWGGQTRIAERFREVTPNSVWHDKSDKAPVLIHIATQVRSGVPCSIERMNYATQRCMPRRSLRLHQLLEH